MKKNIVITIARQYGSGGRTVARMLSEKLGIDYYDKDLLRMVSEESGISADLFAKTDESIKSLSFLKRIIGEIRGGELLSPDHSSYTSPENLFNYQAEIIKKLADQESCVIVGRCADYILRDRENVISCFVHAPMPYLLEQASHFQSLDRKNLQKYIEKSDAEKKAYYAYHTGHEWSDAHNYDLCLDSSRLGFEKTAEAIIAYAKVRFGEDVFES